MSADVVHFERQALRAAGYIPWWEVGRTEEERMRDPAVAARFAPEQIRQLLGDWSWTHVVKKVGTNRRTRFWNPKFSGYSILWGKIAADGSSVVGVVEAWLPSWLAFFLNELCGSPGASTFLGIVARAATRADCGAATESWARLGGLTRPRSNRRPASLADMWANLAEHLAPRVLPEDRLAVERLGVFAVEKARSERRRNPRRSP